MTNLVKKRVALLLVIFAIVSIINCTKKTDKTSEARTDENTNIDHIIHIKTMDQLKEIIEKEQNNLIIIDLYADWCMPCKVLTPILKELAKSHKGKVNFYKVNVQNNPDLASAFNVRSIPLVVFIKEKEVVHALVGLNPKEKYEEVIKNCGYSSSAAECRTRLEKLF